MKFPELIIFDCDGTLVDSEPISNQVVADMMNDLGISMTRDRSVELFAGKSFKDIIAYIEHQLEAPLSFDFEPEFRKNAQLAFEKFLLPSKGVVSFIENLQIPYCVASNGPTIKMETTLKVTGLNKYFNEGNIFSAYDIQSWKPEPDLFLHATKKMGFLPERCLVIEDTTSGIQAAINAKIPVIVFDPKNEKPGIEDTELIYFSSFEDLDLSTLL